MMTPLSYILLLVCTLSISFFSSYKRSENCTNCSKTLLQDLTIFSLQLILFLFHSFFICAFIKNIFFIFLWFNILVTLYLLKKDFMYSPFSYMYLSLYFLSNHSKKALIIFHKFVNLIFLLSSKIN